MGPKLLRFLLQELELRPVRRFGEFLQRERLQRERLLILCVISPNDG